MEEALPYYLAIGMTYEQYWYASPSLVIAFRKAHKLKIQMQNEQMYLQGVYNFKAVETALSNFHLDGKHHKNNDYLKEPFKIFPDTKEEKERKKRLEQEKINSYFRSIMAAQKARREKEQKENGA